MNIVMTVLAVLGLLTLAALLDFLTLYAARSFVSGRSMNDWRLTLNLFYVMEFFLAFMGLMGSHPVFPALYLLVRAPAVFYALIVIGVKMSGPYDSNRPDPPPSDQDPKQLLRDLIAPVRRLLTRLHKALGWIRRHAVIHIEAL